MALKTYAIIIEKQKGNYSAYCPDLPGCIATGRTVDEMVRRMEETIEFHLAGLKAENQAIPELSTIATSV